MFQIFKIQVQYAWAWENAFLTHFDYFFINFWANMFHGGHTSQNRKADGKIDWKWALFIIKKITCLDLEWECNDFFQQLEPLCTKSEYVNYSFCIICISNEYVNEPPQGNLKNVGFRLYLDHFISKTLQDTRMWVLVHQNVTFTPNITKIKLWVFDIMYP